MTEFDKVDRTVMRKVKIGGPKNDFHFWQQQSFQDRLRTLESIRQEYHRWKYGSQPGFSGFRKFEIKEISFFVCSVLCPNKLFS